MIHTIIYIAKLIFYYIYLYNIKILVHYDNWYGQICCSDRISVSIIEYLRHNQIMTKDYKMKLPEQYLQ